MVPIPDESSKDVGEPTKFRRQEREPEGLKGEPDVSAHPTPIRISRRTRTALILAALVALAYVVYRVPDVLTMTVGGIALALILSFPVGFLSRFMPRGLAILLSFLLVMGLVGLAVLYLVPLVVEQFVALLSAVPGIASTVEQYLQDALNFLHNRGLLPTNPDQIFSRVRDDLVSAAQTVAGNVLSGAFGFIFSTFGFAVTLFGVVFVGAYLLVDVRRIKAAFLRSAPHAYRHDAKTLWEAFGYSLSKYLGGLALVLAIQGAISAVGLFLLGVPYALVLGAVVSIMAVIPYLGAWISGILAVIVALTVSPTTALLTALLFLGIQQLEGNFLTPKIQGDTLHVHPILVFLVVIIGGGLGGIPGVIVAVPTLAVLRILFDFFRVRLKTDG
ncbi:MAG: AI-2E family transporter [Actinomycetota bacterium]|nr:AI-2E family transporter [Actinomycetota bacterium]